MKNNDQLERIAYAIIASDVERGTNIMLKFGEKCPSRIEDLLRTLARLSPAHKFAIIEMAEELNNEEKK